MRTLFRSLSVHIGIFFLFSPSLFAIMGVVINHLVTLHYYEMDNQILHTKIARVEELLLKDPDNSIVIANRLKSYFDIPRRVILKVERPIGTTIYATEGVNFPTQTFFDQGHMGALQEWQDGQMHYHVIWKSQALDSESSRSFRIITGIERNYHFRF